MVVLVAAQAVGKCLCFCVAAVFAMVELVHRGGRSLHPLCICVGGWVGGWVIRSR